MKEKGSRYKPSVLGAGPIAGASRPPLRASGLYLLPFLFLLVFALPVSAYVSPGKPAGFVNDFAGVMREAQRVELESKLSVFEKATGVEISAVTIPSLGDETVETYAVKLFEEWGIGKENQDNGLLILVVPNEKEARIETGYGLEPVITDVVASTIMREVMIPAFKAGDYYGGMNGAADLLIGVINNDPEAVFYISSVGEIRDFNVSQFLIFALILAVQLIPVIIYSKSWWLGGLVGFVLGFVIFFALLPALALAVVGLVADYFLSKKFGGKRPPGTHGGVWWGGIGGGRSGGGFGGFGGGMSGGGGASGRW